MVVAHEHDDAAMLRRAGGIGMPEDVARAVDARPLPVPHAEHAVVPALATHLGLLGAPQRRRREVFVEARLEHDVARHQIVLGPDELLVEAAERRAAIARHVSCRIEPGLPVALVLHERRTDQRLRAGHEDPRDPEIVLVLEGHHVLRHAPSTC